MRKQRLRDNIAGYLFTGPALILIGIFSIFPVFFTVYVSLFKWRPNGPAGFLGLGNYVEMFGGNPLWLLLTLASIGGFVLAAFLLRSRRGAAGKALGLAGGIGVLAASLVAFVVALPYLVAQGDKEVFDSIRVTIWYSIGTVPIQLAAGMVLAVLLNQKVAGRQAFRVVYLIPYIAPAVATAAIFELLLSLRTDSFANQLLGLFGAQPLQWLQEPRGIFQMLSGAAAYGPAPAMGVIPAYWSEWAQGPSLAMGSIIIYSWWVFIGYYSLLYLNGLSNIPRQLYEAAEVDGAGKLRSFFSITVPLLSPTTYLLTILGVMGTFKAFTHIFVLRHAAAAGTVDPVSVSIFFTYFRKSRLGYASAVSMLLFAIVLGLTVLQRRTEKRLEYGD